MKFLCLLVSASLCVSSSVDAASVQKDAMPVSKELRTCSGTGTEPIDSEQLRPLNLFRCSYSGEEAAHKVTRLLALRRSQVSEREIRRILSVPELPTAYDSPYSTHYRAVLNGSAWSVRMEYGESFFPQNGPARFSGPSYPRRLSRKKGDWELSILPLGKGLSSASSASSSRCFSAYDLARAATKLRWKLQPPAPVHDSGLVIPTYGRGDRESLTIIVRSSGQGATDDEMRSECSWNLNVRWNAE